MKCSLGRRSYKVLKVILVIYLGVLVYFEWISYFLLPFSWSSTALLETLYPQLKVFESTDPKSSSNASRNKVVRILLVADPQIQGFRNEPPGIIGSFARWDIDRYLAKTYQKAFDHIDPHMVVFLGDLLDEGSIATDAEYDIYATRFHAVFHLEHAKGLQGLQCLSIGVKVYILRQRTEELPIAKALYLPGDNDVGGEGGERVTPENVARFRNNFPTDTAGFWNRSVGFHEANVLTNTVPVVENLHQSDRPVPKILFSHMPLLHGWKDPFAEKIIHNRIASFMDTHRFYSFLWQAAQRTQQFYERLQILAQIKPTLIVSAHTHKGAVAQQSLSANRVFAEVSSSHRSDFSVFDLHASPGSVQEIVVPTCSYRMGVPEMGYGVAVIDLIASRLFYSVLWTPSRYNQLFCELWATCVVCLFVLMCLVRQNLHICLSQRKVRFSFS